MDPTVVGVTGVPPLLVRFFAPCFDGVPFLDKLLRVVGSSPAPVRGDVAEGASADARNS